MNCRYAREVINLVIDGEDHPLAGEARLHVEECPECRQWHAEMQRVLGMLNASPAPLVPDIADMVTNRLPAQHPASSHSGLTLARALSWLAAAWLLGLIMGAGLLVAVLPEVSVARFVEAVGLTKSVLGPIGTIMAAMKTAFLAIAQGMVSVAGVIGLRTAIAVPLVIDLVLLVVILLVWHRRRLISNACLI